MTEIVLISLVILAIFLVQTENLRNAVIVNSVFGMGMSFVFLLYGATDVAVAQAVISTVISTIIFIVALQQYQVYDIFCRLNEGEKGDTLYRNSSRRHIIDLVYEYCKLESLSPRLTYTNETRREIIENHIYELIVEQKPDGTVVFVGHSENLKLPLLKTFVEENLNDGEELEVDYVDIESYDDIQKTQGGVKDV